MTCSVFILCSGANFILENQLKVTCLALMTEHIFFKKIACCLLSYQLNLEIEVLELMKYFIYQTVQDVCTVDTTRINPFSTYVVTEQFFDSPFYKKS